MKKAQGFIVFTMLFLLIGVGLFAQNAQELRTGSVLAGNLGYGDEVWYNVRPAETGFLIVETTGSTDTYLEAYDANQNLLMENDDGGEGFNARIEMYVTAGRNYLFKLSGYSPSETGQYRISASYMPTPTPAELRFGVLLSKELSAGTSHWYIIRSEENSLVTVETKGSTDTYIEVYDTQYKLLLQDDDSGEDYNAKAEFYCDSGQTYLIKVRAYSNRESGLYRILAFYESIPADMERNTERSRAIPITLGEAVPVFFRVKNESRWYRYEITRSGTNFIVQTRGSMDTMLFLYDSHGNLITENDDSGDDYNALISERLNAGIYYIEVTEYSGQSGRCTLHAETR